MTEMEKNIQAEENLEAEQKVSRKAEFFPEGEYGITLSDNFERTGNDYDQCKGLLKTQSEMTEELIVNTNDIILASFIGEGRVANNMIVPPPSADGEEEGVPVFLYRTLDDAHTIMFEQNGNLSVPKRRDILSLMIRDDIRSLQEEESRHAHVHVFLKNAETAYHGIRHLYISEGAVGMLCQLVGLTGEGPLRAKTLARDVFLAEGIQQLDTEIKFIIRKMESTESDANGKPYPIYKIFGTPSKRYKKIQTSVLTQAVDDLEESAKLGRVVVKKWYVSQDYTEFNVEFPDAADEFTKAFGFEETITPGLRLRSSDTGRSSVSIEPTWALSDDQIAIGAEKVRHQHIGSVTEKEILDEIDANVLTKLKDFPEAMFERMAVEIGEEDLSTAAGRRANKILVKMCLRAGMKHLGINKILGKVRKQTVLDALYAEIDGGKRYTEFDIACKMMGLAKRVHSNSHNLNVQLAKAAGRAAATPYYSLAMKISDDDLYIADEDEEL